jgi:hypothetical protein
MHARIAYLTPLFADRPDTWDGPAREPLALARGIAAGGAFEVDVIAFGAAPRQEDLGTGVRLRVLPIAFQGGHPLDLLSWDLPAALAEADLVHIHQAFTRTAEMGMLLAKAHHKPVCVSARGAPASALGEAVDFLALADCVVCGPDSPPGTLGRSARTVLVEWDDPMRAGQQLARVYRRLLARGEEAAA